MSRYEDPEGTGEYPAGGKRRSLRGRSSRAGDTGKWDASGRSRGGRRRSDPWQPSAGDGRRFDQSGQPPSRTHRVLGRHPVVSVLAILVTLTLTFISIAAYATLRSVYDSIHHVIITSGELGKRPPKLNGSENILIIGSDSRTGTHGRFGRGIQGSRSDTSMILHIPPTHTGAIVISFPRDTMVPIYECTREDNGHPGQQAQPGMLEQLNSTFSYGGPACLWKTLEQVTHIHIDHFVMVNFEGFKSIVNDIGGVPVCLPYPIRDPASKLNLPAGKSVVHGDQALAFVRERHIGLGSDLQRINRQQIFLASLAQKIKQSSSLSNPARLYTMVHDIASSLTADTGLTFTNMYAIANSLRGVSTKAVQFITVPVEPYPANPGAQVEFWQPYAGRLFHAIARDNRILKVAKEHKPAPVVPTVSPGKVQVQVLNATATAGLAHTTAGQLSAKGFKVAGTGNATTTSSTVIEYGVASQLPEASTLQQEITGAQIKEVSSLKGGALQLILGSNFKGLASAHKGKSGKQSVSKVVKSIGTSTASSGFNGSANICGDKAAFAGPDTPSQFSSGG
jgi:LCP family protein required for cell wall assembly